MFLTLQRNWIHRKLLQNLNITSSHIFTKTLFSLVHLWELQPRFLNPSMQYFATAQSFKTMWHQAVTSPTSFRNKRPWSLSCQAGGGFQNPDSGNNLVQVCKTMWQTSLSFESCVVGLRMSHLLPQVIVFMLLIFLWSNPGPLNRIS